MATITKKQVWKPKERVVSEPPKAEIQESRTTLIFNDYAEVEDFIQRFPAGSVFWTVKGKPKTIVNNLFKATQYGLAYDIAAEVYVCPICMTCARNKVYFTTNHQNCGELFRNKQAYISTSLRLEVVDTFDVFPRYATIEQEKLVGDWMADMEAYAHAEDDSIDIPYQIFNSDTGEVEERIKQVDLSVHGEIEEVERTYKVKITRSNATMLPHQRRANRVIMRTNEIKELIDSTLEICHNRNIKVSFVDHERKRKLFPRIPLKHTIEPQALCDPHHDIIPATEKFISQWKDVGEPTMHINEQWVQKGWSGVVLHKDDLEAHPSLQEKCVDNLFVVLGRCKHGDLQNALKPDCCEDLVFYTDAHKARSHILWDAMMKCHPDDHKPIINVWTDEAYENMGYWLMATYPFKAICKECVNVKSIRDWVQNMRASKAYQFLRGGTSKHSRDLFRWLAVIQSELMTFNIRDAQNTQEDLNRNFLGTIPIGPLFEIANQMNQAVVDIQRGLQQMHKLVTDVEITHQARDEQILNEIARIRGLEFMQTEKLMTNMKHVAMTYRNLINTASQPLSIHTMRQLLLDARSDEAYEFDIMRGKGAIAIVAPGVFRKFDKIYSEPGVYNVEWTHLTPGGELRTDLDYLRTDLKISQLHDKIHKWPENPLVDETCIVSEGEMSYHLCERVYECFVPIPHIMRVGNPQNPTLIRIQDMIDGDTYLPRQGYCYVLQFVLMLGFVGDTLVTPFVEEVGVQIQKLGNWPLFEDYMDTIKQLILKFPTAAKAPAVLYVVNHAQEYIHAVTTLGCVNKNEHYLNVHSVAKLHETMATLNTHRIMKYRIGGVLPDLRRMIASADFFEQTLIARPRWLVHILISPSQIWAISQAATKYRTAESLLRNHPDIAVALAGLVKISHNFQISLRTAQVIDNYFDTLNQISQSARVLTGPHYEFFQVITAQYAATRYSMNAIALMDQFGEEKNTIVELEELYRPIIRESLIEFGLSSRSSFGKLNSWAIYTHAKVSQRINDMPTLLAHGSTLVLTRLSGVRLSIKSIPVSWIWTYPQRCGIWLSDFTKTRAFGIVTRTAASCIKSSARSLFIDAGLYAVALSLVYCALQIIRKIFKRLSKMLHDDDTTRLAQYDEMRIMAKGNKQLIAMIDKMEDEQSESLVHHAQGKADNMYVKILAWISLFVGCFNVGLANDIYFAVTKYRTLLDIATTSSPESLVFHAQDEQEDMKRLLDTRDNFIDFVYQHDEHDGSVDRESLDAWYTRICYQERVTEHPLKCGQELTLTRLNSTDIAESITRTSHNEFTVIGGVGTGKSTKLPGALSIYGPVLILVPSRELSVNLAASIEGVTQKVPSVYMHNCSIRGTSNITIMTYGYALIFFYHNRIEMQKYKFIQMDECHEFSEHMICFYAWWKENSQYTKLVKTTATPPGARIHNGFVDTNHEVIVQEIPSMTVDEFCRKSIDRHVDGLQARFPNGGRILIFAPSRKDCEYIKASLITMGRTKIWAVYRKSTLAGEKLIEELNNDHTFYQIIVTTTVLQNGVNLSPDGAIDFGITYEAAYDTDHRILTVRRRNINPGELIQRVGRIGRDKPGTFIQVGKRLDREQPPNACTTTNAILISFAMELAPYVGPHLIEDINWVTREQIKTAMLFSAPLLFMIHYIRRDGKMLEGFYHQFKGLLLRTSEVILCHDLISEPQRHSYRTLRDYQLSGEIEHDEPLPAIPIPFYSNDFAVPFYIALGHITAEAIKPRSFTVRLPVPNVKKAVLRLSTSEAQVDRTIGILQVRLQQIRERLDKFNTLRAETAGLRLTNLFNTCYTRATSQSEKSLQASLILGTELLSSLEIARAEKNDKELEKLLANNPMLSECLIYHGGQEAFLEQYLFPTFKHPIKAYLVAIACLTVGVGCLGYYYLKRRETLIMHAGKKRRTHAREDRYKRTGLMGQDESSYHWVGSEKDIIDDWGAAYAKKNAGKKKPSDWDDGKQQWDSREGTYTNVFKTLYDLDPTKFKYVVAEAPGYRFKKKLNRQEKKRLSETIIEGIRSQMASEGVYDYPEVTQATLYLFGDPGQPAKKVILTPHNPLAVSQGSGNPVGFPSNRGELRQTGPAMEMTEEEKQQALASETIVMHAQARIDISHVEKNVGLISDGSYTSQCFITQSWCVAPYHLASYFKQTSNTLTITTSSGHYTLPRPLVHKILNHDLVIFKMPGDFPPMKKISCLRKPNPDDEIVLITTKRTPSGLRTTFSSSFYISEHHSGMMQYALKSVPGFCGGPVMSIKDGQIIGFHSAARVVNMQDRGSTFTCVNEEVIEVLQSESSQTLIPWLFNEEMVQWKGVNSNLDPRNFPIAKTHTELVFHGAEVQHGTDKYFGDNLTIQGRINQSFNNRHVIKGSDTYFDEFVMHVRPAPERVDAHLPSDLSVEAFFKDFLKYATPVELGRVDLECLASAVDKVISHLENQGFAAKEFQVETNFYTLLNSMNLDTAMGALYQTKKRDVLVPATHEELSTWFTDSLTNLYNGKFGIWKASLKAELRPLEKVQQHKTRVFTAAPFDVSFGAKAFVDGFNNKFYERQAGSHWTVGINKFNCGWDELARRFNHDWKFIDADGSRYDSSLTPLLFNCVLHIREHFMDLDEDEKRCLRNLYTQLVWTPVSTITGQIVKKCKGGPSGQPSTVVDNTLMLMIAVEYSKLRTKIADSELNYTCNGDDLLLNASPDTCTKIRESFTETMKDLGLTYEFDVEVDNIGQVEYMSHKWLNACGMLIPKLSRERIMSILRWNRSFDLESQANKINAAWIESFGYADIMDFVHEYANWWSKHTGKEGFLMDIDKVTALYLTDEVRIDPVPTDLLVFHSGEETLVFHATVDGQGTQPPQNQSSSPATTSSISSTTTSQVDSQTTGNLSNTVSQTMKSLYVPPLVKSLKTEAKAKQMMRYTPPQALISSSAASIRQFNDWANTAAEGYGKTIQQFTDEILPFWIYWCVVNGATEENKTKPKWTKAVLNLDGADGTEITVDENGPQVEFEMGPMYRNAKPGIRAIMRHFGELAYKWVQFSVRSGKPIIPHNAVKAGLTTPEFYPCCIDFVMVNILSPAEIDVRNQVINARTPRMGKPLFRHALRAGGDEDTDLRREDDANYGRTQIGGAHFGRAQH
nr:polyprotein [Sugarcane streak mosaic virus]